jgi:hypothetical protein
LPSTVSAAVAGAVDGRHPHDGQGPGEIIRRQGQFPGERPVTHLKTTIPGQFKAVGCGVEAGYGNGAAVHPGRQIHVGIHRLRHAGGEQTLSRACQPQPGGDLRWLNAASADRDAAGHFAADVDIRFQPRVKVRDVLHQVEVVGDGVGVLRRCARKPVGKASRRLTVPFNVTVPPASRSAAESIVTSRSLMLMEQFTTVHWLTGNPAVVNRQDEPGIRIGHGTPSS